ncbi:MAG: hypothetical protein ACPLZ9_00340 [Candidatus Ratteibacteria bacterium]
MKIIDSHIHTQREDCDDLIDYAKKFNICKSFLLGDVLKYGYNQSEEQVKNINDLTIKLIQKYPDFFVGFCYLNPRNSKKFIIEEVERCILKNKFKGIKLEASIFASDKTGKRQIYMIDYDGFNLKQITDVDYLINYPRYFKENEILFVSYQDGYPKISKIDIISKKIQDFLSKPGLNACISVCRETKEIAVVLSYFGNPEIFVVDFNGNIKRRITNYKGIDSSPSFSPDGKNIAFVSDRHGKPQIYLMDKDGYGVKRISYISNYCTSPTFSPDGNFIAYIYSDGSGYGLAIYDINTEKTKTIPGLNCEEISWAPDSRHIVYSKTGEKEPLMIIDIYTKNTRKLISGNFKFLSPCWFILE